jgi:hypothetical protein
MLFKFTMRKSEETIDYSQGFEQETEDDFNPDPHANLSDDDDDAIEQLSLSEMSKFRGGRSVNHLDRFNTNCGGIIPQ